MRWRKQNLISFLLFASIYLRVTAQRIHATARKKMFDASRGDTINTGFYLSKKDRNACKLHVIILNFQ